MPPPAAIRYPFPTALAEHDAAWEAEIASDTRRELLRQAIDRIEHAQVHEQCRMSAGEYMGQAASLLEQAGETALAGRAEAIVPFGGDLVALLRDVSAVR